MSVTERADSDLDLLDLQDPVDDVEDITDVDVDMAEIEDRKSVV